ncbi:thiamine transporter 2-like [Acanthaster planci]|uniref:Thiamine transporter 2-like n=1 Tax=Acanthaster planci TaxID=133434 RepID=A0A8B7ZQ80_ACAPL|nr:thiamine transporter 2-like [Acanthaster planci]
MHLCSFLSIVCPDFQMPLLAYYKHHQPRRWVLATALVCLYGFLKAMRPSEPFLTPYLIEDKNITERDLDNVVYPYWTYSYMLALVPVFLFTDLLRYKPVVVFEGMAYVGTWAILLWGQGVPQMILMQCIYGLATATEIAYYAYIFAAVPTEQFQRVSSYTRSAILTGNFMAGALSQLLISLKATTYYGLNIASMTSVVCSLVVAIMLPNVRETLYFHRSRDRAGVSRTQTPADAVPSVDSKEDGTVAPEVNSDNTTPPVEQSSPSSSDRREDALPTLECCGPSPRNTGRTWIRRSLPGCRDNFTHMWSDFKSCYGNFHLLKWSLWWAFATCGNFQVGNYVQNLWEIIDEKPGNYNLNRDVYNGAVEAVSTLTGAVSAFLIMFVRMDWRLFGELLLGVVSLVESVLLVIMGTTSNIWLCYAFYILFRSSYQLVITIATYQIAKYLALERYALVFGLNMFIALVLGSVLTFIVVDSRTLNTPPDVQFIVYGGYFFILACAFNTKAVYSISAYGWRAAWRDRLETRPADRGQSLPAVAAGDGEQTGYQPFYNDSDAGNESDV